MEETQHDQTLSDEAREHLREAMTQIQDATFDVLLKKPRREITFFVHVEQDGRPRPVRLKYRSLDQKAFDDLLAAHQPNAKDERKGAQWDPDTFPPALISAVAVTPQLSYEQADELLNSKNWSPGEISALFRNALNVCQAGLDVPFSAGD